MDFLTVVFTFVCLLAPIVILLLFKYKGGKQAVNKTYLLFIDGPDPDNPAFALALWNNVLKHLHQPSAHLHIILTGRPVNLSTQKKFHNDSPIKDQIPRQPWETINQNHSEKLLKDSSARIRNYLSSCGIQTSSFTIYNGGIAPCGPISDAAHDWEFLYDRKDLVTGLQADRGSIISGSEYGKLVQEYNSLSAEDRETALCGLLRDYKLSPLSKLRVKLTDCEDITIFLGGPATAVVELFRGQQNSLIRSKVVELYAMFGALSPADCTLLGNQFNAACDMEAAAHLFINKLFPNAPMYIIPTETAKLSELIVSASELEQRGAHGYVVDLMKLWEWTHNGQPQPVFDVIPVMAALPQFQNGFTWLKKKVVVQDWTEKGQLKQQLMFVDTDSGTLYVSDGTYSNSRECFLQFLDLCFSC